MFKLCLLILMLNALVVVSKRKAMIPKCGKNSELSTKNDTKVCECQKGFVGNPLEECLKIPDDVCEQNPCGPNSQCIDDKDDSRVASIGPYCVCLSDTYGLPPNCKKRCSEDAACNSNKFCNLESGKCEKGCRDDHSTCKSDEYCDYFSKQCRKGCRSNHENCEENEICNQDSLQCTVGCRDDGSCKLMEFCDTLSKKCVEGCRSDENCAAGEYCDFLSSNCLKGCNSDENCEFDEFCDFKTRECSKGCRSNGENCNASEYCDENSKTCQKGCNSNSQCDSHEHCDTTTHACASLCSESQCGQNSICTARDHEIYCSCKDGFIPEQGVGCRERLSNETNLEFSSHKSRYSFCTKFCAEGANCGFYDKKLYCTCSNDRDSNSFLNCKPQFGVAAVPGVLCDCCTANQKPGCEVPIDANLLKTLVG